MKPSTQASTCLGLIVAFSESPRNKAYNSLSHLKIHKQHPGFSSKEQLAIEVFKLCCMEFGRKFGSLLTLKTSCANLRERNVAHVSHSPTRSNFFTYGKAFLCREQRFAVRFHFCYHILSVLISFFPSSQSFSQQLNACELWPVICDLRPLLKSWTVVFALRWWVICCKKCMRGIL